MPPYLRLLRPHQWTKNLLVFAALVFTGSFDKPELVRLSLLAFAAMCLVSSAIYVFNDLLDIEADRRHPDKRSRPLASGQARAGWASLWGGMCLVGGLGIGWTLGPDALGWLGVYLLLQAAYNLGLKQVPIADVFVVSLGFVLRAGLGAVAIDVKISAWLLLCTLSLALALSIGKRRSEFIALGGDRGGSRASLNGYTRAALDGLFVFSACGAALFYGVYAIESHTARQHPGLILTALFVFYGVARYVFLVFAHDEGGEPDALLIRDPHLLLAVGLFLASAILAMRGLRLPVIEGAP